MNLFIEIPCVPDGATPAELSFVDSLKTHLELNYHNYSFGVSRFAQAMKMSMVHLNRKVLKLTGYSTGKLILEYRLHAARYLLISGREPVKNIAGFAGFNTHTSFCRCFTQAFKISPSVYREIHSPKKQYQADKWKIPITMRGAEYLLEHTAQAAWFRELIIIAVFGHHTDTGSMPELAALLHTTSSTLSRKLKKIYAVSPHKFIRDLKLQYAAELLHTGSCTITEAAVTAGFFDHPHFCHCFKIAFGVVPSSFKLKSCSETPVSWLKNKLMIENVK